MKRIEAIAAAIMCYGVLRACFRLLWALFGGTFGHDKSSGSTMKRSGSRRLRETEAKYYSNKRAPQRPGWMCARVGVGEGGHTPFGSARGYLLPHSGGLAKALLLALGVGLPKQPSETPPSQVNL